LQGLFFLAEIERRPFDYGSRSAARQGDKYKESSYKISPQGFEIGTKIEIASNQK
jgi:hypothetical protein